MRKALLMAVALGGLVGLTSVGASAAPLTAGVHVTPTAAVTQVDYRWHGRHWHHRRWEHHHWRYYD